MVLLFEEDAELLLEEVFDAEELEDDEELVPEEALFFFVFEDGFGGATTSGTISFSGTPILVPIS